MAKILLYDSIYEYSAQRFIEAVIAAKGQPIDVHINCRGGSPEDAFGMILALQKHDADVSINVDGQASSMAAFLLCYAKKGSVKALNVSDIMVHRAGYPDWIEANPLIMTAERWADLDRMNAHLREALEARIDAAKFEAITGASLDMVFSREPRKDYQLTAKQAQDIGLIDDIETITPQRAVEINATTIRIAAEAKNPAPFLIPEAKITEQPKQEKPKNMTLAEFKAAHPEVYAQAKAEGVTAGITAENDRVLSWNEWADVDPVAVKEGIEKGEPISAKAMSAFAKKMASKGLLGTLETGSAAEVDPKEEKPTATAQTDEVKAFRQAVDTAIKPTA